MDQISQNRRAGRFESVSREQWRVVLGIDHIRRIPQALDFHVESIRLRDEEGGVVNLGDFDYNTGPSVGEFMIDRHIPGLPVYCQEVTWSDLEFNSPICTRLYIPSGALGQTGHSVTMSLANMKDYTGQPWPPPMNYDESTNPVWSAEVPIINHRGIYQPFRSITLSASTNGPKHILRIKLGRAMAWVRAYIQPMKPVQRHLAAPVPPSQVKVHYQVLNNVEHDGDEAMPEVARWQNVAQGWRCAFCDLRDLRGEEELQAHFVAVHREDCWVKEVERETVI